jgi:hypothetical protein
MYQRIIRTVVNKSKVTHCAYVYAFQVQYECALPVSSLKRSVNLKNCPVHSMKTPAEPSGYMPEGKRKMHPVILIPRRLSRQNIVVFTLLALLCNLCSSAYLDWKVCGSADGTHGLLSDDYKVIGFGVYHIGTE